MRFQGVDAIIADGPVVLTGECDDEYNITAIDWEDDTWEEVYAATVARDGPCKTVPELNKHLRRIEIGFLDEEEVEKGAQVDEIVKLNPKKKQVFGWAYTTHDNQGVVIVDHSGEFIDDVGVLEDAAYGYVLKSRVGGADHKRHDDKDEVVAHSTMIESMVFTPDKIEKMGIPAGTIPQGAWWVGFQVHGEDAWSRFESGELTSFSIHGSGLKKDV
jgi:hypothetical protein